MNISLVLLKDILRLTVFMKEHLGIDNAIFDCNRFLTTSCVRREYVVQTTYSRRTLKSYEGNIFLVAGLLNLKKI